MFIERARRYTDFKLPVLAAIFAASTLVTVPASAETEVITVTARKQSESLQTVPVTVTAIGGQTLERFNYDKVADLVARIPTLNVQVGGSGSGGQLSLRGVGSSNISAAFDSAVAFDFDGVQVSTMRIVQSAFFDVQQIEVLKGPQSLFFGKSASAGVISIHSANPTEEMEYGLKVAYEFEEQGITTEAFVSGPISDKVGFRLAARFNDINKLLINSAPVENRKRGEQNINIRGTLQLDPSDSFSANLKLNYIRQENDGALRNAVIDCGPNGVADIISLGVVNLFGGAGNIDPGYNCDKSGDTYFFPDQHPGLAVQAEQQDNNGGVSFGLSKIFFGRLEMDWDITDDLTLTSVTGYLDQNAQDMDNYSYGGLLDGDVSGGVGTGLTDHQLQQFTQELRVTSSFDGPFNFMLGVFYESRKIEFNTNQQAFNISIALGPDPVTGNTFDYFKQHHYDNEALSVWGSIIWNITDDLELSGGVRWTDEKKVNVIMVPYMYQTLLAFGFVPSGFVSPDIIFKDDNISPEATLSYHISDDVTVYASYKTGFKSGGIDNSVLPSGGLKDFVDPDPEVRAAAPNALLYDSETSKGGEIGVKTQWADRTVTLNASAYYYVFTDLQIQNFDAVAIQFATSNASELTTKGFDLDFNWVTPTDGLNIFGALAYTHASFTQDFDPDPNDGVDINIRGRASARAPKLSGNIGADYRVPVGNGLELGFTGNVQFSGKYFTNEDSNDDIVQKSYATFDLAVSIGDAEGRWEFSAIGRNLSDKRFINTSGGRPFLVGGVGDDQVLNLNRGRQIFLEGSLHF